MNSSASIELSAAEAAANRIRHDVHAEAERLRLAHPWLRHRDAIGSAILLFALAGMGVCAALYISGRLPAWLCIPLVALCASLTHELEHDLIHWMYFRKRPWAHHLMMALVWMARPSTINPWVRRGLHFNHHKVSGSETDIEERAITNGERWGLARLLMTGDNVMSVLIRAVRAADGRTRLRILRRSAMAYFPLGWLNWAAWYGFLALHLANALAAAFAAPIPWPAHAIAAIAVLDTVVVVLVAPNVLRTFCLHFISSNMHYYGDVAPGNVVQQTQVLNPWWLWPLQLFCFNFGSTHAIHHFVVGEPFWMRQLTAAAAHRVMRSNGVRFNDFGTFRRANRWRAMADN
jgi:hypothetical protein